MIDAGEKYVNPESLGIQEYQEKHNMQAQAQAYENKPWYPELCHLLEHGYCVLSDKLHKYPIFDACSKLSYRVSYRNYFGQGYVVSCGEFDRYALKRQEVLTYFLEKAKDELSACATDWTWKSPKPGMLKEWADAAFRYERLRQMIDEIHHRHRDFKDTVKIYVGTIAGWGTSMTKTKDPHPYITQVNFNVEYTSNTFSGLDDEVALRIDHDIGIEWFINRQC